MFGARSCQRLRCCDRLSLFAAAILAFASRRRPALRPPAASRCSRRRTSVMIRSVLASSRSAWLRGGQFEIDNPHRCDATRPVLATTAACLSKVAAKRGATRLAPHDTVSRIPGERRGNRDAHDKLRRWLASRKLPAARQVAARKTNKAAYQRRARAWADGLVMQAIRPSCVVTSVPNRSRSHARRRRSSGACHHRSRRVRRSTNPLSMQRPLPSMLILIARSRTTFVNAYPVN
jgi:hypothetical protein